MLLGGLSVIVPIFGKRSSFILFFPLHTKSMDIKRFSASAVSYALANGLLHGEYIGEKQLFSHMPLSLLPFPVRNATTG